ncbi:MAG: trigger factor [Caulobacterales bacterium]|jgi:trigger factor
MPSIETQSQGLRRTIKVVIPANELKAALDAKIRAEMPKINLKGFRPGKAPESHIRKMYGPALMRDIINEEVERSTQSSLGDARLASQPDLELESDMAQVQTGNADLAFKVNVDLMPDFEPIDPSSLALERPVADVEEGHIEEALDGLAKSAREYAAKDGAAEDGDQLIIDFLGKLDGEPFAGGEAQDAPLVLGSGRFIPGFEEQLVGAQKGDEKVITVTFPDDYGAENLKGKTATFDITVKDVQASVQQPLDDEFAKKFGMNGIEALRDALKSSLARDNAALSRARAKRVLFDKLDEAHTFELPAGMVDAEFGQIWEQVKADREAGNADPDDANKSEDELQIEYRKIAARRVRLGLVLAEIGRRNDVQIRNEELAAALQDQARRFPGSEQQIYDFYRKNPGALAQLRAPIYEDKVVDFILELAQVTNLTVTREELRQQADEAM